MAEAAPNTGAPTRAPSTLPLTVYEIGAWCMRHRMNISRFGREAVNDPAFVQDLRRGREPGNAVIARVRAFMSDREGR